SPNAYFTRYCHPPVLPSFPTRRSSDLRPNICVSVLAVVFALPEPAGLADKPSGRRTEQFAVGRVVARLASHRRRRTASDPPFDIAEPSAVPALCLNAVQLERPSDGEPPVGLVAVSGDSSRVRGS